MAEKPSRKVCAQGGGPGSSVLARVAVGLDVGKALVVDESYAGPALRVAELLSRAGDLGAVLLTEEVYRSGAAVEGYCYADKGYLQVQNVKDVVHVFQLVPAGMTVRDFVTDIGSIP